MWTVKLNYLLSSSFLEKLADPIAGTPPFSLPRRFGFGYWCRASTQEVLMSACLAGPDGHQGAHLIQGVRGPRSCDHHGGQCQGHGGHPGDGGG